MQNKSICSLLTGVFHLLSRFSPVFKLALLKELRGNPVHLVSGIEQTERPQLC